MKEGEFRISSGCAVACIFHEDGKKENGNRIISAMRMMHDRSNGLGGGFVGYGIYPSKKDLYAFHLFYEDEGAKTLCEELLYKVCEVDTDEKIPTVPHERIQNPPLIWRYFVKLKNLDKDEAQQIVDLMFLINETIPNAYVFSCGKNMGVFKGVGYPEDIGEFYDLKKYYAHTWIAHGRYPTNTPGWWAGAHPFSMLDYALVHNGEISSYDTNRKMIEMYNYHCSLLTDTEVITYIIDYVCRKKQMTFEECANVIAAPFWEEIDCMPKADKQYFTMLRRNFAQYLITGPFSIILGFDGGIFALNDRLKLRALMSGYYDHTWYLASEESAISSIQNKVETVMSLDGGVPFIKYAEVNI